MELRSSVKTLNYIKKFLLRETDGILPYPARVQKPMPQGRAGTPLPRALPAEAGVPPAALEAFLRALAGPCGARRQGGVRGAVCPLFPFAMACHPQPCQKLFRHSHRHAAR